MGTCGLCGQIGVWTGWLAPSEEALARGAAAIVPTSFDWLGMILICFVLPAVLSWAFCQILRKIGWIREGDLTLPSDSVKYTIFPLLYCFFRKIRYALQYKTEPSEALGWIGGQAAPAAREVYV